VPALPLGVVGVKADAFIDPLGILRFEMHINEVERMLDTLRVRVQTVATLQQLIDGELGLFNDRAHNVFSFQVLNIIRGSSARGRPTVETAIFRASASSRAITASTTLIPMRTMAFQYRGVGDRSSRKPKTKADYIVIHFRRL
jgi:hypothetical protein